MSAQRLSTQETAKPVAAADPVAVDAKKVDREMELAENETDGAQDYRTRVEEARLPDDVRLAALREVGKLERTSDQSPESDDIRNWLDTMLDLPWSTQVMDSIDIQGSREVEARLQRLIEPAVANVEEDATAKVDPAVADVEVDDPAEVETVATDLEDGDTAKVHPAEVDTKEVDREEELAENETDGAQDYRTRVEKAQLPDDVPEGAALREVGKLERTSDQSPESDDIRNRLDTMLDQPWSTQVMDSIDIQGSREVEAKLQRLIEPAVADVEEDATAKVDPAIGHVEVDDPAEVETVATDLEENDSAKVDPAAADSENADSAPAGPHDDDTVDTPGVLAGFTGRGHPRPQVPDQQVVRPALVETPTEKRRFRSLTLAAAALAVLLIGALLLAVDRDRGVTSPPAPTVTATPTVRVSNPTSEPSNEPTGTGGQESTIELEDLPKSGRPSQTVPIQGRFRDRADAFLRVQRWEGGKWLDFPLTTKTDRSGRFTAYVELVAPGRYQLRLLDSDSLVTSKTFVLVIKG